jgi:hypothetical protein
LRQHRSTTSEKLSEGKTIDVYVLIEKFRNHYRRREALKSSNPGPGSVSESHSAFAILDGETQDGKKTCLCGREHLYRDCYYLNSEARPKGWEGKSETFAKINEKLNQKQMQKLKNLVWKWFKYDATILKDASAPKASNQSQSQSSSPPTPKESTALATASDLVS